MANYAQKAFRGAGITLIFSVLASLVAYITRVVLARKLTPEEFGLFFAIFNFVIFFLFFRDLGLPQALVKYIAEFKILQKYNGIKTAIVSVFTFQLLSSAAFSLFFFLAAEFLAENYFHHPLADPILKFLAVYTILSVLFIVIKSIFQGLQLITWYASVELLKNGIVLGLILLFLALGRTLFAPVLAYVLVSILLFVIYFPFVLYGFNFFQHKLENFKDITAKLFRFGIPVIATDIGGKVIGYIDTIILTYYVSLTEVGIYNVVLPSALVFVFLSKAISSVLFPLSTELWTRNKTSTLSHGLNLIHKYIFILILPVLVALAVYSKFLIITFFGSEYSSGSLALQILIVGVGFYVAASTSINVISGIGKPKAVTIIILSVAALNTILNLIFIPLYGINGAAATTTLSYLLMLIWSTIMAAKYVKSRLPFKEWLLILFPGAGFLGGLLLSQKLLNLIWPGLTTWIELPISGIFSSIIYFILLQLFGLLNLKEAKPYFKSILKRPIK